MKKLLLLSFAFVTGTAFSQNGATASATVNAEIVAPITISSEGTINFGRIAVRGEEGKIVVSTEGVRTGPEEMLISSDPGSSAKFIVNAADGYVYRVNMGGSKVLTLEGDESGALNTTMAVEFNHDKEAGADGNYKGNGDNQTFNVGGTLTVNNDQAPGRYAGEVTMTVAYE